MSSILTRHLRSKILFILTENLLSNYYVPGAILHAVDIKTDEDVILPLEEHVFSRKADAYVDSFSVVCESCARGMQQLPLRLMSHVNLEASQV